MMFCDFFSLLRIALHSFYLLLLSFPLFFSSPLLSFPLFSSLLLVSPLLLSSQQTLLLHIPLTTLNTSNEYCTFNSFLSEVRLLYTG